MRKNLMSTTHRLLCISIVLSLATPVYAADWMRFATDKAGTLHEVDRSSLRVENGLVYTWIKRTFTQPQTLAGMSFSTEISKMAFKCVAPFEVAKVQLALYDTQGKHVDGHTFNPVKFVEPIPDSIGDTTRKLVCDLASATTARKQKDIDSEQAWFAAIEEFKDSVRDHEGIDYDTNQVWADAWDTEVKRLANQPSNGDKPAKWFLEQAHKNVKQYFAKK